MASIDVLSSTSPILGLWYIAHDQTLATSAEAVFFVGEDTKSWTVGGAHLSIASAAVFSERRGHYAAVVTESNLGRQRALFWPNDFSGTLLNAPSSVPLQLGSHQAVSSLFPHPVSSSNHDFIAVLGDCTVILLDSSAGSIAKLFGQAGLATLHTCLDGKTLYVMAKAAHAAGNGRSASVQKNPFTLIGLPFGSSSSEDIWSSAVKPPQMYTALQSFAVCGVTLTCVWGNGSVTVSSVNPTRGIQHQHTLDIPAADIRLRTSQAMATKKRRNQDAPNGCHAVDISPGTCSVIALHEHTVVVLAPAHDAQRAQFIVLNTLFGSPVSTGCVEQDVSRLPASSSLLVAQPSMVDQRCHGSVVIAQGGSVVRTLIPAPQPSLAGAVGCLARAQQDAQAAVLSADYLLARQTASCPQSLTQTHSRGASDARKPGRDVASSIHNSFLVRSQSSWDRSDSDGDKDLVKMLQTIAHATLPIEDTDEAQELLSVLSGSSILLTGDLLEKLAGRLQASKQWVLLDHLIRHRPLRSLPLCPHILAACARAGQYRMLSCLMREARDVAQLDFVDMMRELTAHGANGTASRHSEPCAPDVMRSYAYGVASKLCVQAEAKKRSLQSCQAAAAAVAAVEGFSGVQIAMHATIAFRLDVHDMLNACRALDSVGAEHLLAYLQRWLELMLGNSSGAWFNEVVWHEDLCVPSLTQVLLWCQAAIDTQAMVPGTALRAKSQLQALTDLLSAATLLCQEVATLTGMIKQLQTLPADLSRRQDNNWTIDVLDLHVDRRV